MVNSKIKVGISAKFYSKAPVFYGESDRHIQYLETSIAKWISKRGALPLMIPCETGHAENEETTLDAVSFASELDALILQGGVDIHPSTYGHHSSKQKFNNFDLARDQYELCLIQEFIRQKKPIFGICRGLQLLNVHFGGTLVEDLESTGYFKHFDKSLEEKLTHEIQIMPDSHLGHYYNEKQFVSSIHHQGIEKLGGGLLVEATTNDNLIEAFSKIDLNHFILAVQWHPEFHTTEELMKSDKMFEMFLNAAKNRKFFGHLDISRPKKIKIGNSTSLSLGVELELQLLNKSTFDLSPSAPSLINETQKKTQKIKAEIFQSMIEVETSICSDAHQIHADLQESLKILTEEAEKINVAIGSIGTHPFAKYSERIVTDSHRYRNLIESKQWIARRIAIFGLHCHVGARSPEETIELYRFYLSVAPLLLSISASSPYFQSENTGLNSVRSTFFESTPSGGHPPIISSWNEFEGLLTKFYKSKAITSPKDLWWDVRPSLNYGTVEIRVCDMMPSLKENCSLVAFIHLLGFCFLKYKNDYAWPILSEWSYRENKWRALRYGTEFDFIIADNGSSISSQTFIRKLLSDFDEEIKELNYVDYMSHLLRFMLTKCPAQRMMDFISNGFTFEQYLSNEAKNILL